MAGTRAFSEDEQVKVLDALDRLRDRVLLLLGLYTGFRITELLRLTVGDVWKSGAPVTVLTVQRQGLKGGAGVYARRVSGRSVPLNPAVRAALSTYLAQRFPDGDPVPDDPLFLSRKGGAISYVQAYRVIKAAAESAGVTDRIGTHSMRKTFARSVYDGSGHDIVLTKEAVGHRSIATTSAYLSASAHQVAAAILAIRGPAFRPEMPPAKAAPAPQPAATA